MDERGHPASKGNSGKQDDIHDSTTASSIKERKRRSNKLAKNGKWAVTGSYSNEESLGGREQDRSQSDSFYFAELQDNPHKYMGTGEEFINNYEPYDPVVNEGTKNEEKNANDGREKEADQEKLAEDENGKNEGTKEEIISHERVKEKNKKKSKNKKRKKIKKSKEKEKEKIEKDERKEKMEDEECDEEKVDGAAYLLYDEAAAESSMMERQKEGEEKEDDEEEASDARRRKRALQMSESLKGIKLEHLDVYEVHTDLFDTSTTTPTSSHRSFKIPEITTTATTTTTPSTTTATTTPNSPLQTGYLQCRFPIAMKGSMEDIFQREMDTVQAENSGGGRVGIAGAKNSYWNKMYRALLNMDNSIDKYDSLAYLAHDFEHCAQIFGRIIITERYLPLHRKTIKPITTLGGIAGGDKFKKRGILFKFAVDKELAPGLWMYGGPYPNDSAALKAAGHELRAAARITDRGNATKENVNIPLMALVDYQGFRLMAVAILPITKDTICYGSSDGGKTVHTSYHLFNNKMQQIFSRLNLKRHLVNCKHLYTCGDIEGHWGADGELYLCDYARVFPPESGRVTKDLFPTLDGRAVFYKMLRPELVGRYPVPLCSDAYSGWIKWDPDLDAHHEEVDAATLKIVEVAIPKLVQKIIKIAALDRKRYASEYGIHCSQCRAQEESWSEEHSKASADSSDDSDEDTEEPLSPSSPATPRSRTSFHPRHSAPKMTIKSLSKQIDALLHSMHTSGINFRFMGLVRWHLCQQEHSESCCVWKYIALLYTEMAARVCKNMVRALLREKMKELQVPSSEPYKQLVLLLFNLFSSASPHSNRFWTSTEVPHYKGDPFPSEEVIRGGPEYYIWRSIIAKKALAEQKQKEQEELAKSAGGSGTLNLSAPKPERSKSIESFGTTSALLRGRKLATEEEVSGLLPMKCCIYAKYGKYALTEEEWNCPDQSKPFIFKGLFFYRLTHMLSIRLNGKLRICEAVQKSHYEYYRYAEEKKRSVDENAVGVTAVAQAMIGDDLAGVVGDRHLISGSTRRRRRQTIGGDAIDYSYAFMDPHIKAMDVLIKSPHIVASSEGMALWLKAREIMMEEFETQQRTTAAHHKYIAELIEQSLLDSEDTEKVARLLLFAKEKFESSLVSIPDSISTLIHLGKIEHWLAIHWKGTGDSEEGALQTKDSFQSALHYFVQGERILRKKRELITHEKKTLKNAHLSMARLLCDWSVSTDEIVKETTIDLWRTAWSEFYSILMAQPRLKARYKTEIKNVTKNGMKVYQSTQNVGMLIATIMRIEAIRKLDVEKRDKRIDMRKKIWHKSCRKGSDKDGTVDDHTSSSGSLNSGEDSGSDPSSSGPPFLASTSSSSSSSSSFSSFFSKLSHSKLGLDSTGDGGHKSHSSPALHEPRRKISLKAFQHSVSAMLPSDEHHHHHHSHHHSHHKGEEESSTKIRSSSPSFFLGRSSPTPKEDSGGPLLSPTPSPPPEESDKKDQERGEMKKSKNKRRKDRLKGMTSSLTFTTSRHSHHAAEEIKEKERPSIHHSHDSRHRHSHHSHHSHHSPHNEEENEREKDKKQEKDKKAKRKSKKKEEIEGDESHHHHHHSSKSPPRSLTSSRESLTPSDDSSGGSNSNTPTITEVKGHHAHHHSHHSHHSHHRESSESTRPATRRERRSFSKSRGEREEEDEGKEKEHEKTEEREKEKEKEKEKPKAKHGAFVNKLPTLNPINLLGMAESSLTPRGSHGHSTGMSEKIFSQLEKGKHVPVSFITSSGRYLISTVAAIKRSFVRDLSPTARDVNSVELGIECNKSAWTITLDTTTTAAASGDHAESISSRPHHGRTPSSEDAAENSGGGGGVGEEGDSGEHKRLSRSKNKAHSRKPSRGDDQQDGEDEGQAQPHKRQVMVTIRDYHGKNLLCDPEGRLYLKRKELQTWVLTEEKGGVTIRSLLHAKYLYERVGKVALGHPGPFFDSHWQMSLIERRYHFRSLNKSYLSVQTGGNLTILPGAPREYGTWNVTTKAPSRKAKDEQLSEDESWVSIRSVDGFYLGYDSRTGVKAHARSPQYWLMTKYLFSKSEKEKAFQVVTLSTGKSKGKYLAVSPSDPTGVILTESKADAGWLLENAHTKWPKLLSELYAEIEQIPGGYELVELLRTEVLKVNYYLTRREIIASYLKFVNS